MHDGGGVNVLKPQDKNDISVSTCGYGEDTTNPRTLTVSARRLGACLVSLTGLVGKRDKAPKGSKHWEELWGQKK